MAETQQLVVGPPCLVPLNRPKKAFQSLQIIGYNGEDFQDCFLIYFIVASVIFSCLRETKFILAIHHFPSPDLSIAPWRQYNGMHIELSTSPVETATA
jgi:hypothetical protein